MIPQSSGIVIGAVVQAALYTAVNNDLTDWRGHQYGFYYMAGCLAVAIVLVVTLLPARIGAVAEIEDRAMEVEHVKAEEDSI
jgi:hypothetical protein